MIYALATLSTFMFALATALQHRSAQKADSEKSLRPALLLYLALDPAWLIGIGADIVGLFFQFAALVNGSVLVVQAILAVGLVFSLFFSAVLHNIRLKSSELVLSGVTAVALIGFLSIGVPSRSIDSSTLPNWIAVALVTASAAGVLVDFAYNAGTNKKTLLLGAAAGILHGFTVSLSKVVAQNFVAHGMGRILLDPHLLILAVMGAADILVLQSAFQAGPLRFSLPVISVVEPVVAFAIGIAVLGERLSGTALGAAIALTSLAVMLLAVWGLARVVGEESSA